MGSNAEKLLHALHIQFLRCNLKRASPKLTRYESTSPTMLFFMLSGLDILRSVDGITDEEKSSICAWIYSQQIEPRLGFENDNSELKRCGFFGSRMMMFEGFDVDNNRDLNVGNLAMTYSCLCCLLILGDDLSRVNKLAILKAIKFLQNEDGSFFSSIACGENDIRFLYCAIVICYILNDFSHIDVNKAVEFVLSSMHYDGGIGMHPNLESHGGSSFCGIAVLSILGKLDSALGDSRMRRVKRWLLLRQETGFQGRPYKEVDTCYSFWIGAALKILGVFSLVDWNENRKSILKCQKNTKGGFSKYYYSNPDILHTYFALCGLSLMEEEKLSGIHPSLNLSMRAYNHLKKLHLSWFTFTPPISGSHC